VLDDVMTHARKARLAEALLQMSYVQMSYAQMSYAQISYAQMSYAQMSYLQIESVRGRSLSLPSAGTHVPPVEQVLTADDAGWHSS
jgi:hypothetical protein